MTTLFPITKRAWIRLKLTWAESVVMGLINNEGGTRSSPRNIALVSAAEEIAHVRDIYYPREADPHD